MPKGAGYLDPQRLNTDNTQAAPELAVSAWRNSDKLTLAALHGRPVAIHMFQMLCPGCAMHGVPQAQRLFDSVDPNRLAVLGLHSVFEHHNVMTAAALDVFIHEFRLKFPIAIDAHIADDPIPVTMRRYQARGTPTWILIDKRGRLRANIFGQLDDLSLGLHVGNLLAEPAPTTGQ